MSESEAYQQLLQFLKVAASDDQRAAALKIFLNTAAGKAIEQTDLATKVAGTNAIPGANPFAVLGLICKVAGQW